MAVRHVGESARVGGLQVACSVPSVFLHCSKARQAGQAANPSHKAQPRCSQRGNRQPPFAPPHTHLCAGAGQGARPRDAGQTAALKLQSHHGPQCLQHRPAARLGHRLGVAWGAGRGGRSAWVSQRAWLETWGMGGVGDTYGGKGVSEVPTLRGMRGAGRCAGAPCRALAAAGSMKTLRWVVLAGWLAGRPQSRGAPRRSPGSV